MPTFQGVIAPSGVYHIPDRSSSFDGWGIPRVQDWTFVAPDAPVDGVLTEHQPINPVPSETFAGVRACTYFDDYYNRFYIFPTSIDYGAVTDDVARQVQVWNANLTSYDLDSASPSTTDEGIEINGPGIPATFLPLQLLTYEFVALTDGPALIDVVYTLQFSNGDALNLTLTGTRARVWEYPVNWRRPYRVTYSFDTEIITSRSGKEQRRANRHEPRKKIDFLTMIKDKVQFERFKRLMVAWQNKTWVIPDVTRTVGITSGVPVGSQTVELNSTPNWVVSGALIILKDRDQYEIGVVDSIIGTTMTLKSQTAYSWTTTTVVLPGLACRVSPQLQTIMHTDSVGEFDVVADVIPGSEPELTPPAPLLTLKGREWFTKKPNWERGINRTDQMVTETLDFGHKVTYHSPYDFTTVVQQADFVNKTLEDAEDITNFFLRLQGRQGEFYMSNFDEDMELRDVITNGQSILRMKGQELIEFYQDDTTRRAIVLSLSDGRFITRTVDSMVAVDDIEGSDTNVNINAPIAENLGLDDVDRISWLVVWRMASDSMTVEWLTNEVSRVRLPIQTLEDLAEE